MDEQIISKLTKNFEDYAKNNDGTDFWYARDLQKLLGYEDIRNFLKVIDKAKEACKNASFNIDNHFVEVAKMVSLV